MAALLGYASFTSQTPQFRIRLCRPFLSQTRKLSCTTKLQRWSAPKCSLQIANSGEQKYEVSYNHDVDVDLPNRGRGQGWTDADGNLDQRMLARFRGLIVLASDRVQMHNILAKQRSNWNHLFHSTVTIAAVSSAVATALNGTYQALGLTVMATLLNLACAALMTLVNKEQPSQLAEEQRRAARFFKRLMVEVEATLEIDPQLREDAAVYWEAAVGTLHTLDGAFPLPLSPNGLEKFPEQVLPAELTIGTVHADEVLSSGHQESSLRDASKGWTKKSEEYLRKTVHCLTNTDIPTMIQWAEKAKRMNLVMAKTSPVLAAAAAVCSIADAVPGLPHISWLAAALTVAALFSHSVSHALQLGSGFEMYRNHAGYYAEIHRTVERTLQNPAQMRMDRTLFLHRLNLQLGHHPQKDVITPHEQKAGMLF